MSPKFVFVLLALSACFAQEQATPDVSTVPSKEELSQKKSSELKQFLKDRGVGCPGCVEKSHFVQRVLETWNLPKVQPKQPEKQNVPGGEELPKDIKYEDIMKMFNKKKDEEEELVIVLFLI